MIAFNLRKQGKSTHSGNKLALLSAMTIDKSYQRYSLIVAISDKFQREKIEKCVK